MLTRGPRFLLLLALTSPTMGCIARLDYAPNTNILNEIGVQQGQTLMAEILTRARRPRIADVEATPEYFSYTTYGRAWGWAVYGMVGNKMTVYYNNVLRVDIYANDRVMVYDLSGRRISQFDFLTRQDSLHFADLVAAFQSGGQNWPAPNNPSPAPRDDYTPPPPPPAEEEHSRNVLQPDPNETAPPPARKKPRAEEPPPTVEPVEPGGDEEHTDNLLNDDDD
jgi:hypothetical protein